MKIDRHEFYIRMCKRYGQPMVDAVIEATDERCGELIRQIVILKIVVKGLLVLSAALAGSLAAYMVR